MSQYIGARYVPDFQGTYDPTQSYENMVVVDNGMGTSYISRKPVPAGTPLTDTDYWALYGASNGAIINLQNQIDAINDEVTDIRSLSDPNNRNFLLIADSYGMRPTSQPTWTERLDLRLNNCRQKSVSSIGFTTTSSFLDQLTAFYNELTEAERNAVTDIVVGGGWNDGREITSGNVTAPDVQQAIFDFVDYAAANFINAKVWLAFIGWQSNDGVQVTDCTFGDLMTVEEVYNQTYYDNLYHIPNASYVMKCCKMLDNTYFHPNPTGSLWLAHLIYNGIFGGNDFHYNYGITGSDLTVASGSATINACKVVINNGIANILLRLTNVVTDANNQLEIDFSKDVWPSGHQDISFMPFLDYTTGKSGVAYINPNRTIIFYFDSAVSGGAVVANFSIDTKTCI